MMLIISPHYSNQENRNGVRLISFTKAITMKETQLNNRCGMLYPGEYIPLPKMESMLKRRRQFKRINEHQAHVTMFEKKDCFMFEVALPAAKREEIFFEIFDNTLSIVVLPPGDSLAKQNSSTIKFGGRSMERSINLPEYADAEFISAEFKQGV